MNNNDTYEKNSHKFLFIFENIATLIPHIQIVDGTNNLT